MKKVVSLILALMMCLSLCACRGGNNSPDKYIGTWDSDELRLVVAKGGIGQWGFLLDGETFLGNPITWEVKDGLMIVTKGVGGFDYYASFELGDSPNVLNEIQKSGAFSGNAEDDTEYVKVP